MGTSWETVKGEATKILTDVQVDSSKLPLSTNEQGEQVLCMYWINAYEDYSKGNGELRAAGPVHVFSENDFCYHSLCL